MKRIACLLACTALVSTNATAQTTACSVEEEALAGFQAQYEPAFQAISDEGEDIESDASAGVSLSGKIEFTETHMALHLPSVTMTNRKIAFDVPQVTMKQRGFSWKVPEVHMVDKVIAVTHVPQCTWFKCKMVKKEIITAVPETRMVLKKASTDIPEFTMATTSFITKIPEVTMKLQDLYYKLPSITVDDIIPDYDEYEERGEKLGEQAEALKQKMDADSAVLTDRLFACYTDDLVAQRGSVAAEFESGITQLTQAIETIRKLGADPANFAADGAAPVNLVAQLEELIAQREVALKAFDDAIADMVQQTDKDLPQAAAESIA